VQIRLGEEGWKTRYYSVKMEWAVDGDMEAKRREMVYKYVEGLCWVLKYYFEGCQSWGWYYPYHYAPFASDFKVRMQVALVGNVRRGTYLQALARIRMTPMARHQGVCKDEVILQPSGFFSLSARVSCCSLYTLHCCAAG
jgi:hypothetical protein